MLRSRHCSGLRSPTGRTPRSGAVWHHALASAAWARMIAVWRQHSPASAFLGGLFSLAGHLVVAHQQPSALRTAGLCRSVSGGLAAAWALPASVVACATHADGGAGAPRFADEVVHVRWGHAQAHRMLGPALGGLPLPASGEVSAANQEELARFVPSIRGYLAVLS